MKKILIFIICTIFSVGAFSKENKVVNGVETVYDDTKGTIETVYNDTKSVVTTIYSDMKGVASEIYPDVKNALSEIARGLGIGVEYTWTVLVKQYVVIAIAELLKLILSLAIFICGIVWLWKIVKNNTAITWKIVPGVLMLIIGLSMMCSINIIEIIQGLINPDFGAINYILQFIKTL
jgi:hypothetical protein